MALFFDHAWFDAELAKRHLRRDDVASMLGLSPVEISEIWKDQRELKALMRSCGFGHVDVHNLSAGIVALHVGIKC